ncbi:hypothetical protein M378DRAFT_185481 [Amanita muscaria Koide BX008]|uniref:DNA damage-binding protein 1 n=1 Tax=Amanita muscaria (strain Koide BX008) TaxID=946122 RepID=A0A0C2XER3_AMAMK|nr:hypothetical protein M378DRAFT_185481 [Amanita muscaria Koide BX008]
MKIVTTFHHPSSVLTSVKCQLGSRDTEHLIVGKLNKLVVYSIQPHGLQKECSVDVWGKVLSLKAIPIPRATRSNLVLMVAHPDPELVFFTYNESESGTGELIVKKQLPLFERSQRPAEFFNDILVHPSGQLAIVSCYTGKLKLIKLKAGNYQEDFDVSLPELNVFSVIFLSIPPPEYAIAILYLDSRLRLQLHARDIILDALELSAHPSVLLHPTTLSDNVFPSPTQIAYRLASIPASDPYADEEDVFKGGVLVIGGRRILLFELAGQNAQEKQKGKRRRLEARKASDANSAREKEAEREGRRRKPKASVEWPWSEVVAICSVDRESWRFLIGDAYGRLVLLAVDYVMEKGLILIPLGETSSATTLTYLTSQAVYVGSHTGDSQVITISPTPVSFSDTAALSIPSGIKTVSSSSLVSSKGKGKAREDSENNAMDVDDDAKSNGCIVAPEGSYLTVQETHKNIAPIVDAILVDIDNIGQRQIMTCSGGRNTGSLNVVRHGADFEELAYVTGLTNVTNIWPVKTIYQDNVHTHLLVSTLQSTSFFRVGEANGKPVLTVVEGGSLCLVTPTLAFGNVVRRVKPSYPPNAPSKYDENSSLVVQVTPRGVYLLEMDLTIGSYTERSRWIQAENRDIVVASLNASQVVVGLHGGRLVVLNFNENTLSIAAERKNLPEISAVSCTPIDFTRFFTPHIVVSYWGKNAIEIFAIANPTLNSLYKEHQLPSLVRSLLLYNFGTDPSSKGNDYQPYLLVGLSDGSLVTFIWRDKELQEKKLVSLGHAPIILTPCTVEGKRAVLAAGSRATLVSFDKKRLQFSPVSLKDISAASCLNVAAFRSSFALATQTGISIGGIGDLNKLHIRTIPFGSDNPRRIVYDPASKLFGIACTQTIPGRVGGLDSTRSSFVLLDGTTYTQMSRFHCAEGEEITSATILKSDKGLATFSIGTYRYVVGETEPAGGRILILGTNNPDPDAKQTGHQLSLLASVSVKGCVYALSTVGSYIAAAVNSSVELYQLDISDEDSSNQLKHLSAWNHNYIVGHLAAFDNYLVVGDQISSISLVKVIDDQLKSVARDYGPLSPVCVEGSSETNIIVANDALNLYTFSLSRQPGRTALERHGNWHLSDLVTKFLSGSLSQDMEENAQFIPKELFCTSSGRIGILMDLADPDPRLSMLLTALERNMAYVVQGVGGQGHTRYRAPRGSRGRSDADAAATGFLDGDFLELFLSHINSEEIMDKIMAGTSEPERIETRPEELQKVVENLQSMH